MILFFPNFLLLLASDGVIQLSQLLMVLIGSQNQVAPGLRQSQFRITIFYGVSNPVPVPAISQIHVFLSLFHSELRGSNSFNCGVQPKISN
jgi:hypothetical protein